MESSVVKSGDSVGKIFHYPEVGPGLGQVVNKRLGIILVFLSHVGRDDQDGQRHEGGRAGGRVGSGAGRHRGGSRGGRLLIRRVGF